MEQITFKTIEEAQTRLKLLEELRAEFDEEVKPELRRMILRSFSIWGSIVFAFGLVIGGLIGYFLIK